MAVSGRPGQRTVHVVNGRDGANFAGTGKYVLLNAPDFRLVPTCLFLFVFLHNLVCF